MHLEWSFIKKLITSQLYLFSSVNRKVGSTVYRNIGKAMRRFTNSAPDGVDLAQKLYTGV